MTTFDGDPWSMRQACDACGSTAGTITTVSGQDSVRCECGQFQYHAPKLETGRAVRSLSTRAGLTPSRRARILDRFGHACIGCHTVTKPLQIDHLIERQHADEFGFLDEIIDSDHNLAPLCAECNSGKRTLDATSIQLLYRCLVIHAARETKAA